MTKKKPRDSSINFEALQDFLATMIFGISLTEAHQRRICIDCKKPISPEDEEEWKFSGLCLRCFKEAFGKEKREDKGEKGLKP